ncbi:MAG: UDP-2,3-diacylglucosamine pyrophosphatase LpxH [Rickettsiales bacterium]|jgi:UDP-2,3-diacylglucosamine pyrophosphatase LpxH
MKRRGFVISDLHLFTSRDINHEGVVDKIRNKAQDSIFCVLNGDILNL